MTYYPRVSSLLKEQGKRKTSFRSNNVVHAISIVLYTSLYRKSYLQHYACRHWNSLDSVWHRHCSTSLLFIPFLQWATNNFGITVEPLLFQRWIHTLLPAQTRIRTIRNHRHHSGVDLGACNVSTCANRYLPCIVDCGL